MSANIHVGMVSSIPSGRLQGQGGSFKERISSCGMAAWGVEAEQRSEADRTDGTVLRTPLRWAAATDVDRTEHLQAIVLFKLLGGFVRLVRGERGAWGVELYRAELTWLEKGSLFNRGH